MALIFTFGLKDGADGSLETLPALGEVGGKGWSLMRMARAELAVPPGFVLSVAFFADWFAQLQATSEWTAFLAAGPEQLVACCEGLKRRAGELVLDSAQKQELDHALSGFGPEDLFAVRSSSPEEDLDGASFAGAYETVLGVTAKGLENAIRRAFASCLDARIAVYKQQHGFDVHRPLIAVVVQQQIKPETAGVGFSLNPLSNAYDEAVISANWGLGETVVSGLASPDLFVVDKLEKRISERTLGRKELTIQVLPDGGTHEVTGYRQEDWTLSDAQVLELTDQLIRLEALYQRPIDMEWAYAAGQLYLLQARPVTSHLQLPAELITAPGEPKRLYGDFTISVQGIFEPLSVLGTDLFGCLFTGLFTELLGHDISREIDTAVLFAHTGRIYLNFSNVLALAGKDKLVGFVANADGLASATLAQVDAAQYTHKDFDRRSLILDLVSHLPGRALLALEGGLMPEHARQGAERAVKHYRRELQELMAQPLPVDELGRRVGLMMGHLLGREFLPLILLSRVAIAQLSELFPDPDPETLAHLQRLDRSLPHNVTTEMGLALEHLAQLLSAEAPLTGETLAARLVAGNLPLAFTQAWQEFLDLYGHRGPREIDLAVPRYSELPAMLLAQIAQLASSPASGPQAIFEASQRERQAAYEALAEKIHARGWFKSKRFEALYRIVETLGGYRERPKFELVYAITQMRQRVLAEAAALVASGRLDSPEQVYDLTLAELARAPAEPNLDLRALAATHRQPIDKLARFSQLPQVFDSRGRIFQPPRPPVKPGEISGQAISAGVVRGKIKVLHSPDEKPLLPGEILVARATDPGWTPLFVNAAAIVLEVGGLLQHGALVAREYGKPCVAGIENATARFTDGEEVEVDGSAGVIRKRPAPESV